MLNGEQSFIPGFRHTMVQICIASSSPCTCPSLGYLIHCMGNWPLYYVWECKKSSIGSNYMCILVFIPACLTASRPLESSAYGSLSTAVLLSPRVCRGCWTPSQSTPQQNHQAIPIYILNVSSQTGVYKLAIWQVNTVGPGFNCVV